MSKMLRVGLAPVLLVAAFAVIPAVAQAEPHFYSNHVGLPAESGGPGAEGKDFLAWGRLTLITKTLSPLTCFTEWGGDAYNPEGPSGAAPGEAKVDAFAAYDCTEETCEAALNSKMELITEGLNKFGEWEAKLAEPELGIIRLKIGNKTPGSPTQIKFLISCPNTGLGEVKAPAKGELTPKIKNGTLIGSAPSKGEFGAGSGELEIISTTEGTVTGNLKVMGFAEGEIITTSNP
jgi:hypothetical protein